MNAPAYRAVARVARRQAARARWRSALVLATIALPIAALTATAIAIRTSVPTEAERIAEEFGAADLDIYSKAHTTQASLERLLPAGSIVTPVSTLNVSRPIVKRATFVYFSVYEYGTAIDEQPVRGIYHLESGALPRIPGEAIASPSVLEPLGLRIGDTLSPKPGIELRVTGTVVQAGHLRDPVVVLAPGTLASLGRDPGPDTYMVDLPPGASITAAKRAVASRGLSYTVPSDLVRTHERDAEFGTAGAFGGAAFLLLATGLIAGAALAVGARRQLRTLGLLGATGAERRHLRATVLLTGATLGAVGSAIGMAVGVVVAYAVHPLLDGLAGRFVGPIEIPVLPIAGAFALGTLAATLAAALPARTAARVPVVQALAERSAPPRRPGRLALAGIGVAVIGGVLAARGTTSQIGAMTGAGVVGMVVGILVGIPLLVAWTGRIAGALPALPRIAARDVARHGRRTGAALAAGAMAVAIPMMIATETLSDQVRIEREGLRPDQLSLYGFGGGRRSGAEVVSALGALRSGFPGSVAAPIVEAATTVTRHGRDREVLVGMMRKVADGWYGYSLEVGDADLLRALNAEGGIPALERGEIVGLGAGTSTLDLAVMSGRTRVLRADVPIVWVPREGATSEQFVVSAEGAARLGLHPSSEPIQQGIFRSARPLSESDITAARNIVSRTPDVGLTSAADTSAGSGRLRFFATLAGMFVTLVIVGVIVALLAAEARRDRAILVAVGASPHSRRVVAATSGLVVGVLSAIFGIAVGFLPTAVFIRAQHYSAPLVVPWDALAALAVGVPIVAGLLTAAASRQPKAAQLLRPIS